MKRVSIILLIAHLLPCMALAQRTSKEQRIKVIMVEPVGSKGRCGSSNYNKDSPTLTVQQKALIRTSLAVALYEDRSYEPIIRANVDKKLEKSLRKNPWISKKKYSKIARMSGAKLLCQIHVSFSDDRGWHVCLVVHDLYSQKEVFRTDSPSSREINNRDLSYSRTNLSMEDFFRDGLLIAFYTISTISTVCNVIALQLANGSI